MYALPLSIQRLQCTGSQTTVSCLKATKGSDESAETLSSLLSGNISNHLMVGTIFAYAVGLEGHDDVPA